MLSGLLLCAALPAQLPLEDLSAPLENNATRPCITTAEYAALEQEVADNQQRFGLPRYAERHNATVLTSLGWPLEAAPGLHDCSYYHVSAYVDQDTLAGSIRDFNCGNDTYDGHRGTDISTWPFNFYKMDNDLVRVVAVASGTILARNDGQFDRNCAATSNPANYLMVQHADGSVALYWHMKNGSVTTKAVGQTVVAGEQIGVVGSSGSSSGPHLHFEVWAGSVVATRQDPYAGSCNSLNASSWWASQKPALETGIVRASVHSTDIVLPPCPATETLNEAPTMQLPFQGSGLPAGYAKFYIFVRDELAGLSADCRILNAQGQSVLNWAYTSSTDSEIRTFGWSKVLPASAGQYTFEATYNGMTCSSPFELTTATALASPTDGLRVQLYPNPHGGDCQLAVSGGTADRLEVYDLRGQRLCAVHLEGALTTLQLDLPAGSYLYRVYDGTIMVARGNFVRQ
jgi:murein DD-endopeptidase MepM/ murein hydrolase activator NlpD